MRTTTVLADGFGFLEGPRWRDGKLWMSDIDAGVVFRLSPDGTCERLIEVTGSPSGLGFLPDGTPIVVSVHGRVMYRIIGDRLELHADLRDLVSAPINDMVVDRTGRAYVSCMGYNLFEGEAHAPGCLLMIEPDGRARVVAQDLEFPNGSVITAEGRLVVGESFANRLTSFAIGADGSLSDRQIDIELEGIPDGICLDMEGGIWVAMLDQGVARVKDGKIVERIDTGNHRAIACQLGGPDMRTLFILSFKGTIEEICKIPGSRVETVHVDVPGAGSP